MVRFDIPISQLRHRWPFISQLRHWGPQLRYRRLSLVAIAILCATGPSTTLADRWISESVVSGPDAELCKVLHQRLNGFLEKGGGCMEDAIESYPEFKEPPWEELDPDQYMELLIKLERYATEGARAYFGGKQKYTAEYYRNQVDLALKQGLQMHVWRTRFIERFDSGTRMAKPGNQTVIKLTYTRGNIGGPREHECPAKASLGWVRNTFLVLPDLSGPDHQVDNGTAAAIRNTFPVLYRAQPLLIGPDRVAHSYGGSFCRFKLFRDDLENK